MKNIRNTLSFLCFSVFPVVIASAQEHQLIKKWETDTILKVPESVLYDKGSQVLYVSNIDGQPDAKDGKGSIGKVGLDGKIIAVDWVTGLNAPKGLGLLNNTLWVADLDEVAAVNTSSGKIEKRVKIDGAQFLNDITVNKNGMVYVSDTRTKKVYGIEGEKVTTVLENLKGPNGLLIYGDDLYVLDNGSMFKMEKDKTLKKIAEGMDGGTDGIEHVQGNDFIVSCWAGAIYYVKGDGSKEKLLDTQSMKINSADIGYDPDNRIVYVPTFWRNGIVSYQLK
jgi:sugar lactone lactonase YvrE